MEQHDQGSSKAEASDHSRAISARGNVVYIEVHRPPSPAARRPWRLWLGVAGGVALVAAGVVASVLWPEGRQRVTYATPSLTSARAPATTTTTAATTTTPVVIGSVPRPVGQPLVPADQLPRATPVTTTQPAPTSAPTPPPPSIVIAVGGATSSSRCEKGKCYWIATRLTGFAPNTGYEVVAVGNGREFSEPCEARTDANGADDCNTTRYDVPGAEVYVYVRTARGTITSNTIVWPSERSVTWLPN
ncbi:hypothetical protein ACQPZF_32775 [Actinosynnema sp. CS-041913]|uniref:hypothetical protein n=1 Tax=Actinosynnema sp. CS-041913 TaxID=3239917 RepID=UPI003D8F51BE